jgi:hypothetical protein
MSAAIEARRDLSIERAGRPRSGVVVPAGIAAAFVVAAAWAAAAAPIWLSIVTVFVFAGPHNWIEARYFLARLPGRWGRSRGFFTLAIGGAIGMTALYLLMGPMVTAFALDEAGAGELVASWATLAIAWIVAIVALLGRQVRRDWTWAIPFGLLAVAFAWWSPGLWWLGLVYGHPLVALLFLDRELRRRPDLQRAIRWMCAALPLALLGIWIASASGAPLAGFDGLTMRIADHAGATILPSIPDRTLVATHAFLETVHYGVWVVAMPFIGFRAAPWRLSNVPLWRRSRVSAAIVIAVLAAGGLLVATLWAAFAVDYGTTRDVYFSIAMLHVLVEAPFLVQMLAPKGSADDT